MHLWRLDFDDFYNEQSRIYRDRLNPLEELREVEFFERYRFPKSVVCDLCDDFRLNLERSTGRSQSLSVETQVCVALQYYNHGGFLPQVADIYGISSMSAGRAIHEVSAAIARNYEKYISWPSHDDMLRNMVNFFDYSTYFF